jgi:hypothetical protein
MDPNLIVGVGLTVIDEIVNMIKHIKEQGSMTTEQIAAAADAQDLQNKDDIKALLAL